MVAFSSMKETYDWLFKLDPNDKKHQEILHPLLTALVGSAINWVLTTKLSNYFTNKYPEHFKVPIPSWAKKYALPGMIAYLILMLATRCTQQGPFALYEQLWACNIAILMFINGLVNDQVLPLAAGMLAVGVDQSLWYVDVGTYIFTKKFPVGVAKYIVWPETTWLRLMTSTHHLWFLPLVIACLKNLKQYPLQVYLMTYLLSLPISIIPRLLIPKTLNVDNQEVYLNVMCVYELWKDVKSGFLSSFDKSHPAVTMMFSNQGWNACNIVVFVAANFLFPYIQKKLGKIDVSKLKKSN